MSELQILLVDDDDGLRTALVQTFELAGLEVEAHADPRTALTRLSADFPGILVTDIRMPGMTGTELFHRAAAIDSEIPVLLMTGHGDVAMAVAMLKDGAFDFIAKPFAPEQLVASANRALELRRLVLENRRLRQLAEDADHASPLIGQSPAIERLRATIRQVAPAEVDVLVEGETGTGKELVARLLHRASARRARPFVAIDCAALPDAVAEEELFGLGPSAGRRGQEGRIIAADRGTLFLDEIDSMSPALQGKLLRVVEEREVRGGGEGPRVVDLRIVAAAKTDLAEAVAAGRFRADLLYRLDAVRLRVPPLRERRGDVPLLFAAFLREAAERFGRPVPSIDAGISARLDTHDWPGNVRELRNYAQRVTLGLADQAATAPEMEPLPLRVERFEGDVIRTVLE